MPIPTRGFLYGLFYSGCGDLFLMVRSACACSEAREQEREIQTMMTYNEGRKLIRETMDTFPETFGLRAFPGKTFRIGEWSSYVDDNDEVMLYTQRQLDDGTWSDFAKGSPDELLQSIVWLPRFYIRGRDEWGDSEVAATTDPIIIRCAPTWATFDEALAILREIEADRE